MKCRKCGKEILINQYHTCEGQAQSRARTASVIALPVKGMNRYASVQEEKSAIITPGFTRATAEELDALSSGGTGLMTEIKRMARNVKSAVKNPTRKNIIVMVAAGISILIWLITSYNPNYSYVAATGLKGLLAIVFGTYNNVFARTLHFTSTFTILSIFIPQLMANKSISVGSIPRAFKGVKNALTNVKSKKFGLVIAVLGLAYIVGNYMMRNNAMNKYLACVTFGLAIIMAGNELRRTPFIRLLYGLINDVKKLFKKDRFFTSYGRLLRQSFGLGLIATILLPLLRTILPYTIGENLGYTLGVMLLIAGVVIQFTGRETGQVKADD